MPLCCIKTTSRFSVKRKATVKTQIKFLFKDVSINPTIFVFSNNAEFILIPEIFAPENNKSLHVILLVTVRSLLNETSPDTKRRLFKETS